MSRLIAIGDVHGCYYTMLDLMKKVDYSSSDDTIVFIGDYIDKGPHSFRVVSELKKLQQQAGKDSVICLRGNHEQMAIDAIENDLRGETMELWLQNGGQDTLDSFARASADVSDCLQWFKSLPHLYITPQILFCHAGLTEPNISDNTEADVLWGRDWIHADGRPREKQVIFGHTPSHRKAAYVTASGDICIDAACTFGGRLCALILEENAEAKFVYADKSAQDNN